MTLGRAKAQIASGTDVAIGDVLVAAEKMAINPLIAPIAGKAEVTKKQLSSCRQSKCRVVMKFRALNSCWLMMAIKLLPVNG